MSPGRLYRHVKNTTVAIEIIEMFKENDSWNMKVVWWNIGACHEPYNMDVVQDIVVPMAKMQEWIPMGYTDRIRPELFRKTNEYMFDKVLQRL